jgi:hypothetical protein
VDGKAVYLDGRFWIARGNIFAIQLQRQIELRREFYTATFVNIESRCQVIGRIYIFFAENVYADVRWGQSHVTGFTALTPNYVILLVKNGALCLMIVIRHGDTIDALEKPRRVGHVLKI